MASVRLGPHPGAKSTPVTTSRFRMNERVPCCTYSNSRRSTFRELEADLAVCAPKLARQSTHPYSRSVLPAPSDYAERLPTAVLEAEVYEQL
jgi:hypothetical protein